VTAAREAADVLGPWVRGESAVVLGFSPSFHPIARPIMRRVMEEKPDVQVSVRHLHPSDRLVELKGGLIDAELMLPPPPVDPDVVVATVFHSPATSCSRTATARGRGCDPIRRHRRRDIPGPAPERL